VYCPNCGAQNTEGSNYCQGCGKALIAATQSPPPIIAYPSPSTPLRVEQRTSGMAVAALIMGIIGFFITLCSILAIIFGAIGMNETKKSPEIGGHGMAVAGLVLGIISIVFWVFLVLFFIFLLSLPVAY